MQLAKVMCLACLSKYVAHDSKKESVKYLL